MKYIKRIIDDELKEKLSYAGAVQIKGPKWCGKTTSAKMVSKSVIEMQNPDLQDNYMELANNKPSLLLEGDKPRLIDEWQMAPKLWNAVRYSVDNIGKPGQYILTGSSTPNDENEDFLHSGVGRFAILNMKSMTLYESGDSNGKISLRNLLDKKVNIDGLKTDLNYERIAYVLCRGGWPGSLSMPEKEALQIPKNYLEVLCESDISRIDGVRRDPVLAKSILKAYARQDSTIDSDVSLFDDVRSNNADVSDKTIRSYINIFKRLFVIEEIPAWNPNIRSKTAVRTSPKKSFVDPSLAVAALGCTEKELIYDPNTFGLLFENLVNRDLSVYASVNGGYINHYRDRYGLECDNVVRFDDGRYILVEIKLGGSHIKEAEKHLLELNKLINDAKEVKTKPSLLMIITGTDMAYTLESGVLVIPIGLLKD